MLFAHSASGRRLRLAYCMNLHPADSLDGVIEAMQRITLPLAERLSGSGGDLGRFGVGMYFPAALASELAHCPADLERLASFLSEEQLDPFTYNAFPAGHFGSSGLKQRVFEPTWAEPARLEFTRDVARIASYLFNALEPDSATGHVSISTHTGMHASRLRDESDSVACARNLWSAAQSFAELESEGAPRLVLSLEAEPRSNCNDTRELVRFLELLRDLARSESSGVDSDAILNRHLGVCLDACHAAVEFETPAEAVRRATELAPLGKLQFSSALALKQPANDPAGREALLALDEPAFLHQVTGRGADGFLRSGDLPELRQALERDPSPWLDSPEWRCHFHVPVDLQAPLAGAESGGLATTRAVADEILSAVLERPERWKTPELHLEIETYTWDVLPRATRGAGELPDGLQREYEHVLAVLDRAGWQRPSPD